MRVKGAPRQRRGAVFVSMNNQQNTLRSWDREVVNTFLLSVAALIEGLQILLMAIFVAGVFPIRPQGPIAFLAEWSQLVKPERESAIYELFVVSVIAIFALSMNRLQRKIASRELCFSTLRFLTFEASCVVAMGLALFVERSAVGPSVYSKGIFLSVFGFSCVVKLFWKNINEAIQNMARGRLSKNNGGMRSSLCHLAVFVFIFLAIFVRDKEGVVAQIFMKDRFHHFDMFVASPAWAFDKGGILNVDHLSQYGVGMPIVVGVLSRMFGGVSYENILSVLVWMTILYLSLCFFFLRVWLKNLALAAAGIFFILKFQIFSSAAADPIIWRYPSSSAARYFFDIPFFLLIFYHLKTGAARYLISAAVVCGAATAYITDTGLYLTLAFYGYLLLLFFSPDARKRYLSLRPIGLNALWVILPAASLLLFFWLAAGQHVATAAFWKNLSEIPRLVKAGWGALPISVFIDEGKYLNFFLVVLMCLMYVLTVTNVAAHCYRRKMDWENLLAVVIGIYGLGTFHYYLSRSSPDSIATICIPLLLLIGYWLAVLKKKAGRRAQRYLFPCFAFFALCALLTTDTFQSYPNLFNRSKNSFIEEKQYRKDESFSAKDVELIVGLTAPTESVCLMSNLETGILMAANRKPFFYYFPILISRSVKMRDFGGTLLLTQDRLQKTIDDLETQKPRYIFIEKNFVKGLPGVYYLRFQSLTALLKYIFDHYHIEKAGEYLVALKRKS